MKPDLPRVKDTIEPKPSKERYLVQDPNGKFEIIGEEELIRRAVMEKTLPWSQDITEIIAASPYASPETRAQAVAKLIAAELEEE